MTTRGASGEGAAAGGSGGPFVAGRAIALPDPPLTDAAAGIVLGPWQPTQGDVAALVAAWADPGIVATTRVPDDVSSASAAHWIRGEPGRRAAGTCLDLVIAPVDDQGGAGRAVIGEVGLRNIQRGRRRAEVGWWVVSDQRGRGLAATATRLLVDWALSVPGGLVQVWARIDRANETSSRVARAAGFVELGEAGGTVVWARTAPAAQR